MERIGAFSAHWNSQMIDSLFNLLFRCNHGSLTRPVTALNGLGKPEGEPYVVCLDCGKQFAYDADALKMGKALPYSGAAAGIGSR